MKTEVHINDLYRILAMVPVAPSGMSPEDFTAFVGLCGAVKAGEEAEAALNLLKPHLCTALRVDPAVFGTAYNPITTAISKITAIKEIRNATGLGLKEAKDMSEGLWQKVQLTAEQIEKLQLATPGVVYEVSW